MNEELHMYAEEIVKALEETPKVRMEVIEDDDVMVAHVIDEDGVKVCGVIIDVFEDAMEILVYMIHIGNNYNYRMEGKPEDVGRGKPVYIHITNVPH
jgi:23S rRNA G2069 N7-methylase RlmK/C1962 C5-methylase RlmI